jgi:hypothetical protein
MEKSPKSMKLTPSFAPLPSMDGKNAWALLTVYVIRLLARVGQQGSLPCTVSGSYQRFDLLQILFFGHRSMEDNRLPFLLRSQNIIWCNHKKMFSNSV